MVLDASLLNTQHYKVRIKGKVEQSRERSSALLYTLVYRKGSFRVTLEYGRQLYLLTFTYIAKATNLGEVKLNSNQLYSAWI